ncbi:MAG: hypothetical protein KJ955_00935 [Nanoarchaeota archaeon]|nr:hypothetical protein [Nanoarchaeota archaeon]
MAREILKRRYLFVLIATVIVFSLGVTLGILVNETKSRIMEKEIATQNMDDLSLQLQLTYLNFLDLNSSEGCKVMNAALEQSWKNLATSYGNLIKYKDSFEATDEDIRYFERNDLLNNIRYWLLLKEAKTYCELQDSVAVLFFFSETNCDECDSQSQLLEHYKRVFNERFLLFHINMDIGEPMAQILLNQYDINSYPSIVIGVDKFSGLTGKDALKEEICKRFKYKQPECEK